MTPEQEEAREQLREMIAKLVAAGYQPTSMRMLPTTAAKCAIALNAGGFGEFEGIRIKAGAL